MSDETKRCPHGEDCPDARKYGSVHAPPAEAAPRPTKLLIDNDTLRTQIAADPDDEPSAGGYPKCDKCGGLRFPDGDCPSCDPERAPPAEAAPDPLDALRDAGAKAEQAAIDSWAKSPRYDIARKLHYPEHWDTAAYPTLESAIWESLALNKCSECYPMVEVAPAPASEPQAEPQPEAIPIAPVEVVRQALKELLESISECRMDQVTARFAKASVMARAVVDRYKDAT